MRSSRNAAVADRGCRRKGPVPTEWLITDDPGHAAALRLCERSRLGAEPLRHFGVRDGRPDLDAEGLVEASRTWPEPERLLAELVAQLDRGRLEIDLDRLALILSDRDWMALRAAADLYHRKVSHG